MREDFRAALEAACHYRTIGLIPLPSRMDGKRPMFEQYGHYRVQQVVPESVYTEGRWQTSNLQVFAGANTRGSLKVVVVDLDGQEAAEEWRRLCRCHDFRHEGCWIAKTGGGGWHVYFRLPLLTEKCQSRLIWAVFNQGGGPEKHKEIRLLADNALIVMPPSNHACTGLPYRWVGKWNPDACLLPAEAPGWILGLPNLEISVERKKKDNPHGLKVWKRSSISPMDGQRDAVLKAMHPEQKARIASMWGLRLTGRRFGDWAEARSIDRKDDHPSASLNLNTGVYTDFASNKKLSFFDLGIELGQYQDFSQAMAKLKEVVRL